MVSVPACGSSGPSSNLTGSIIFISSIKYLETFRDIRSERREGVAWGVSRNVPRSVSCSFNAYIGTPISNCSYVYSFLAVTFPSISRKVARYLGQCMHPTKAKGKVQQLCTQYCTAHSDQIFLVRHTILPPKQKRRLFALFSV